MLTISPIKTGFYQPKPVIQKLDIQNTPAFKTAGNICYPAIYFTGKIDKTERPPFKDSTVKKLDMVFDNYKKQLGETSIDDINASVDEISKSTEYSKNQILKGMQQLTQFGNINSLNIIGKALNDNSIGLISNNGLLFKSYISNSPFKTLLSDNFGQNAAIEYILCKKDNYSIDGEKIGIFLDKNKLDDLENGNPKNLEELKKKKNIKFFIISGMENGISFLNRNKNLKKETIKLLRNSDKYNIPVEEAIDKELLDRCKKLGISPVVIKNNNNGTTENIYNQLRPEQISRRELNAVLDATVMKRFEDPNKQVDCKDGLAVYLDNKLEVYTPERISKEIKKMHLNIKKTVKSLGKSMDDVLYIIPTAQKSYDLIGYQYQIINDIPKEQFITLEDEKSINKLNIKDKVLVLVDDCSLSGSSLLEDENFIYNKIALNAKNNNSNIIFAPLFVSDKAEERLDKSISRYNRKGKDFVLKINQGEKNWDDNIEDIKTKLLVKESLGDLGWNANGYCMIFPYMTPDNNSELASNIGLFHNINYQNDKENFDFKRFALTALKTFYETPREISHLTNQLLKEEQC